MKNILNISLFLKFRKRNKIFITASGIKKSNLVKKPIIEKIVILIIYFLILDMFVSLSIFKKLFNNNIKQSKNSGISNPLYDQKIKGYWIKINDPKNKFWFFLSGLIVWSISITVIAHKIKRIRFNNETNKAFNDPERLNKWISVKKIWKE